MNRGENDLYVSIGTVECYSHTFYYYGQAETDRMWHKEAISVISFNVFHRQK